MKIMRASEAGGYWSPSAIFRREVCILKSLNHKNIISFIDSFTNDQYLCLIMEKTQACELFEKVISEKRLREREAAFIFSQVMEAILYLHSLNIVHRDIKAENVLVHADGSVKLIDFGLSVRLRAAKEQLKEIVGSAHYIAPEMLSHSYGKEVDVYSAGIMLYLMIFGYYPFDGSEEKIFQLIKFGTPNLGNDSLSPHAIAFLGLLLEKDPGVRLTAGQALEHIFLADADDSTLAGE
jgi:serine/threonine protein kinase